MKNLTNYLNQQVNNLPESELWEIFNLANKMEEVISLSVGEPDFATPWIVANEASYAIESGKTFYTPNLGLLKLREEVCNYYYRRFNLDYNPNQVLMTVGGSEALDLICRSCLNPQDEVIILEPAYIAYRPIIELAGGVCKVINLEEANGFKLTPAALKAAIGPKTKLLLLNYPSNPTGGVMTYEDYQKLVPIIKDSGLLVASDEIYAELIYDEKFSSLAAFPAIKDQVIVINGFSKAYAMTGFRLGYILANEVFIKAFVNIHQYTIICAHTPTQFAAITALQKCDKQIDAMREEFERRRNFLVNNLNRIGLETHLPHGAFYVFCNISKTGLSAHDFCIELLKSQHVALIPGTAFGASGENYVRISYAYSVAELKEALKRIEQFLKEIK